MCAGTHQTAELGLQTAMYEKDDRRPLGALLFSHLQVSGPISLSDHYIKIQFKRKTFRNQLQKRDQ